MAIVAILRDRSCEADQRKLNALGATLAFVDASRIESCAQALSGSQIAISCMASRNVHVDSTNDFWAIDRDANIRFGIEAVRAGAQHVILVATFEGRDSRGLTEFIVSIRLTETMWRCSLPIALAIPKWRDASTRLGAPTSSPFERSACSLLR